MWSFPESVHTAEALLLHWKVRGLSADIALDLRGLSPDPGITKGGSDAFLRSSGLGSEALNNTQTPCVIWRLHMTPTPSASPAYFEAELFEAVRRWWVYDLCWGRGRNIIMHHLTQRSSIRQHQSKLQCLLVMKISLSNKKKGYVLKKRSKLKELFLM